MKKNNLIKSFYNYVYKTGSVAGLVFISGFSGVHAELPVFHPTLPWSSNVRIAEQNSNLLRIGQNQGGSGNWILNWQSFNVDEGSRVQFDQPGSSHIALNRIYQNDASRIMGSIDANGRIYLVNQNGFLFGKNSTINVNSLVASSLALNMSDSDFINNNKNIASLFNDGVAAFDINAFKYKVDKVTGELILLDRENGITINPDDLGDIVNEARINARDGGNILMIAPNVINEGNINTKSGQTILAAAKDKVYLTPSQDPSLRGFLVEVGVGGLVENIGNILSERGNITLAGMAINQKGVLHATTSVSENGSIRLLARHGARAVQSSLVDSNRDELILGIDLDIEVDGKPLPKEPKYFVASETGEVTLGGTSQTRVIIDTSDDTKITDLQEMQASRVEITGKNITLKSGAKIVAMGGRLIDVRDDETNITTGGEVVLHATTDVLQTARNDAGDLHARDISKIILEAGSSIDVSGTSDAVIDMKRNELEVTLTGNFLRDAPLQRDSALRNETVTVDIRDGTPLGDISNLVSSNVKRDVNELSADAGHVELISRGAVLLEENSDIDISGGSVSYADGFVRTSQLLTNTGRIVDIGNADPDETYSSVFGSLVVKSDRWGKAAERQWSIFGGQGSGVSRFYQGYTEGRDAGTLTITANAEALYHNLHAGTVNGIYQREASQRAFGGKLDITLGSVNDVLSQSVLLSAVIEDKNITQGDISAFLISDDTTASWDLLLGNKLIADSGISELSVVTKGGDITSHDSASTNLRDGGSVSLDGRTVEINNDIRIASGTVDVTAEKNLTVNGTIDVSGTWVNDQQFVEGRDLTRSVNHQGGTIKLSSKNGNLLLTDSYLKANGGAWLQEDTDLLTGNGGDIKLSVSDVNGTEADIQLGQFEAYSAAKSSTRGGSLSITTNQVNIASSFENPAVVGELQFLPEFFQAGGFSDYSLISNADNLTLHENTVITPTTESLQFNSGFNLQQSTDNLRDVTAINQLPVYDAPTTNLNLTSNRNGPNVKGDGLVFSDSARVIMTPGSDFNLEAVNNLVMRGIIETTGGDVGLTLNPSSQGYKSDAAIWFDGKILTNGREGDPGTFIAAAENDAGLIQGKVLDSGSVSFNANWGYIVTTENSEVITSGTEHELDLPSVVIGNSVVEYQSQLVNGEAGDISFSAAEGMYLKGDIQARAANVEGASGGKFNVSLNTSNRSDALTRVTTQGRELHLIQNFSDLPADFFVNTEDDTQLVKNINENHEGKAWVAAELINNAGFERLKLQVNNLRGLTLSENNTGALIFDNNLDLKMAQSLELISPIIRAEAENPGQVNLSAPYILLGSIQDIQPHENVAASNGNSVLNIQAGLDGQNGLLELTGVTRLQGISNASLSSDGDIRLRGIKFLGGSTELMGSIESWGNLNLQADQVYATTLSQFDVSVIGEPNGIIKIDAGKEASPVLSAGSVLNFNAPIIQQSGVVKAPHGQINLNASQQVILDEGSITSVSGEGLVVPFGNTLAEERWIYTLDLNVDDDLDTTKITNITTPPVKEINIQSDDIQITDTAVFDISGGGNLTSWEFVPGLGGSVDGLLPKNANGAFAVIPGNPVFAPYDLHSWLGEENINMGDQVYLAGSRELAEGLYTVLPARYALLPGAHLVTPIAETLLPSQQFQRLDGAPVVAGQTRVAGTEAHGNLWSGYVVESSDAVRQRSEYFETSASQFFRDESLRNNTLLPDLPEDAGTLNILAGASLELSGILKGGAASATYQQGSESLSALGRGSVVNISGDNIRVVVERDNEAGIQIEDTRLNGFNASSLLLGGTRERSEQGVDITTTATNVTIGANTNLQLPELVLAAKDTITVKEGASIFAKGEESSNDTQYNLQSDGALLRASVNVQVNVNRENETTNPLLGNIVVETNSVIDVLQSLTLDSSVDTNLDGALKLNGGSLNLGARKISIGDFGDSLIEGIRFSETDLEELNVNSLVLTSRNGIDFYGDIELNLNDLELVTGELNGFQAADEVFIVNASNNIKLSNSPAYVSDGTGTGEGQLQLVANNIQLADGKIDVNGFSELTLFSEKDISVSGEGVFSSHGKLIFDGRITTASKADYAINAGQSDLIIQRTSSEEILGDVALGGKLSISAASILHTGQIDMSSGLLTLNALGENGSVTLSNGSVINLSGTERNFAGEVVYTPGGTLVLSSAQADIQINSGALVDVSSDGNAGSVKLKADKGTINLSGELLGKSGENEKSASFTSQSLHFDNIDIINQQLNNDFNQRRYIHLGEGDITLVANESIVAQNVSLQTDNGVINISGAIDASADKGGKVHLAAQRAEALNDDAIIDFSGSINAIATGVNGEGGDVFIESRGNGLINLAGDIDVSGGAESRGGKVYIRTPRTTANDDVNISNMATDNISGYRRLDIEAYESHSIANLIDVNKILKGEYKVSADAFMLNSNNIKTRLGVDSQPNIHLRAGVELNSETDITLGTDLDLLNSRFAGEAGVLSLRAKNNINLNASLQDGFIVKGDLHQLQSGESWSYNIVAGADLNSASVLALGEEQGNINLENDQLLRTGKGDIKLAASNNLVMGKNAPIYTGGHKGQVLSLYQEIKGRRSTSRFIDNQLFAGLEFPEDGGDVSIVAGGDILAEGSNSLLVTDWLYRVGPHLVTDKIREDSPLLPSMTGVNFGGFTNGVAALGGGDIGIEVAGDMENLAVSIPSVEKYTGEIDVTIGGGRVSSYALAGSETVQTGNGDIDILVTGDINRSLFLAGNGNIDVSAGGNIGGNAIDSGIYLVTSDTKSNVYSGGNLTFQGVTTQNMIPFSENQEDSSGLALKAPNFTNFYSNYVEKSELNLQALTGYVEIRNEAQDVFSSVANGGKNKSNDFLTIYPPEFKAIALDDSIIIKNDITLWPSSTGGISLLAQNDLTAVNNGTSISMLDFSPEDLPSRFNSVENLVDIVNTVLYEPSRTLLHENDSQPSLFVANTGNISSNRNINVFKIITTEQTNLYAGRDILGIDLSIQNNSANNISTIQAIRDIRHINSQQLLSRDSIISGIEINGPGELHVLAGRDINLGNQGGIVAAANRNNPVLPAAGAELLVMAGIGSNGVDYNAFIEQYFTADSEYAESIINFIKQKDSSVTDFQTALEQFKLLDEKQQRSLVINAFSNEFSLSATRAAKEQTEDPSVDDGDIFGYTRGLDAIASLFPGSIQNIRESEAGEITGDDLIVTGGKVYIIPDINAAYNGNISMVASTIQTQGDNADISILAPGGFLNVGLSVSTESSQTELGIITKGTGSINLFTQGDISVNQSRVQALNGGHIAGWSTKGNIDAGRGAKDALVIPPPRSVIDPETGSVIQVFDAAVQGNGIRTACSDVDCLTNDEFDVLTEEAKLENVKHPGGVVLGAPAGVIDAGDAGINSGGNLILATDTVLNANQIEAGGDSTGVPADASALGADLGGLDVNSAGEDAATELVAMDASDQFGTGSIAILQVEVMGLSGESDVLSTPESEKSDVNDDKSSTKARDKKSTKQTSNTEKVNTISKPDLSMNTL